jgi:hypothetical protein
MQVRAQFIYSLELSTLELRVLAAVLVGETVALHDQPILAHLKRTLPRAVADALRDERAALFGTVAPASPAAPADQK